MVETKSLARVRRFPVASSAVRLIKQNALSSCSSIYLLSGAAATTVPHFPSLIYFCSDTIHMAIGAASISGRAPSHQFSTFITKDLYCSFHVAMVTICCFS